MPQIKNIMLRAAKLPLIYIFIGLTLTALAYIDDIFPITEWKHLFDLTDKIGDIFFAFALLTFAYKTIVLLLRSYEKKLLEHHRVASLILTSLRKGMRIIFMLAAINIVINLIGPTQFYLVLANNVIRTIIIGSIGWIAIQVLHTFEAVVYQQMMIKNKDHRRAKALYTKTHILQNIATVVIVLITIAAILMTYNSFKNIGISLLASAGFLTAIIGLAGQKALFSLFSGLQIVLSQPIKIGDIVLIESESGVVEEITFTHVTLKLGDRRRMIVPINHFIEKPFENWSHDLDSLRTSFHFFVDYMMPIAPLREQFNAILAASTTWDGVASKLEVAKLGERSVELRIQVSAANSDKLSCLSGEVREKMLDFIRENYPQCFPSYRLSQHELKDKQGIINVALEGDKQHEFARTVEMIR